MQTLLQPAIDYFNGNTLAAEVWDTKYRYNTENSPIDTIDRIATAFYKQAIKTPKLRKRTLRKLSKYGQQKFANLPTKEEITKLLDGFQGIIPGGSILANLGTNKYSSTSNCFYVELEDDSMESIFKLGAQLASIFKYRGGCGIDITKLRPNGAVVNNAANTSSGAVSFMPLFSEIARVVGQDGRRAAMMISLSIDHPDALAFIKIKQNLEAVTGANISLKITDEFYQAVQRNSTNYIQYWNSKGTIYSQEELFQLLQVYDIDSLQLNQLYTLELPNNTCLYYKLINPVELYNEFIHANHTSAEPGLLFWDKMLDYSMSSYYPEYKEKGTNPCSEIPLADKDACRLFAVNLMGLFTQSRFETVEEMFTHLYKLFYEQTILANYLVDIEVEHIDKILNKIGNKHSIEYQLWRDIKAMTQSGRRIGCGLTGLLDWLIYTHMHYWNEKLDFKTAEELTKILFETKLKAELDASIDLAIVYKPFKGYTNKETSKFITMLKHEFPEQYARMCKYGRRNVSLSTVAPTGTISILGQCSSGIEPVFAPYYIRKRKVGNTEPYDSVDVDGEKFKHYTIVHPGLERWASDKFNHTNWEEIYKQSPYYQLSAGEIPLDFRLKLQTIAQRYTSHAISSTINLPQDTTVDTIKQIYDKAFTSNLKGLTIYREGSRQGILVTSETTSTFKQYDAPKRPKVLQGDIYTIRVKGVNYVIVIGLYQQKPYEIFAAENTRVIASQKGKIIKLSKGIYKWEGENGEVIDNLNELSEDSAERATTIYLSMLMRQGAKMAYIIKAAKKADGNIITFTSAICRILGKYIPQEVQGESCPDCGSKLIREAGCKKCSNCAYSLCLMITHEIKN